MSTSSLRLRYWCKQSSKEWLSYDITSLPIYHYIDWYYPQYRPFILYVKITTYDITISGILWLSHRPPTTPSWVKGGSLGSNVEIRRWWPLINIFPTGQKFSKLADNVEIEGLLWLVVISLGIVRQLELSRSRNLDTFEQKSVRTLTPTFTQYIQRDSWYTHPES